MLIPSVRFGDYMEFKHGDTVRYSGTDVSLIGLDLAVLETTYDLVTKRQITRVKPIREPKSIYDKARHIGRWVSSTRLRPLETTGAYRYSNEAEFSEEIKNQFARQAMIETKPAGRKDDNGKVRMELLGDLSRAIEGVAKVLTWAVTDKKPKPYEPGSWQHVEDFHNRYMGAHARHLNNIQRNGEFAVDKETQLLDLFHLATDALFLAEHAARELEKKVD